MSRESRRQLRDMHQRRVLIVDDEKNIRLTLSEALADMDLSIDTAADGAQALEMLAANGYWLVLLDIRMPGMDGMEVLRRLREFDTDVYVVTITAHGTVENAVESMKLGAVDFLQKPFSPRDLRLLVKRVIEREIIDPDRATDYEANIELARRSISHRHFRAARDYVDRALRSDDGQPEAYNLLGILSEIEGDRFEAQQLYRKALELDPEFAPARANLRESVAPDRKTGFLFGEARVGHDESPQDRS